MYSFIEHDKIRSSRHNIGLKPEDTNANTRQRQQDRGTMSTYKLLNYISYITSLCLVRVLVRVRDVPVIVSRKVSVVCGTISR